MRFPVAICCTWNLRCTAGATCLRTSACLLALRDALSKLICPCTPLLISVSNLRLQSVAPEELDLQTAVELLAKKAARNAAKAAKAAGSSPDSAEPGVVSPSTPEKPRASKPRAVKVGAKKPKVAKGGSKSADGGSDSGSSADGKPGRRKKAAGASGKLAAAAAGGSGPASGNAASSTSSGAGGGGGSRKPSAWMAFRKARWEAVKAQHSGVAGREVSLHPVFRGLMSGGKCLAAPPDHGML